MSKRTKQTALERAVELTGGMAGLGRALGLSRAHVWYWVGKSKHRRIPAEHVLAVESLTGGKVTRHELRPDLFSKPTKP